MESKASEAGSVAKQRRWRFTPARRRALTGLLFVLPGLLPLLLFVIYPMANSLTLSLTDGRLFGTPRFVGLENYSGLLADPRFLNALAVTFKIALGTTIPSCLLAFALALLLDAGVRHATWYQPLFFLPAVLPSVVTTVIWGVMFQGDGVINSAFGLNVGWLTDSGWAVAALVLILVWTNLGYYTVILLAGVRDIPRDYYEAARIDGANYLGQVRYITLPLLRPALLFVIVTATTNALTLFVQPYLLTKGGPSDATLTLSQLVYQTAFSYFNLGKSAAISFVLLAISLLVAFAQFRLLNEREV